MKLTHWKLLFAVLLAATAAGALDLTVDQPVPCNVFETGSEVRLPVTISDKKPLKGTLRIEVRDYTGKKLLEREEKLSGTKQKYELDCGKPERGYYEILSTLSNEQGEKTKEWRNSFGVADFSHRSAKEVRDGGYRFGMKLWLIEEIWWNRKLHWDAGKVMGVCCNLGLQWTRAQLGQRTPMDTIELIRNYPVNVVLKVETYPDEMIDRARYPKITDFTKVKGRTKALMPKKAEYQAHVKKLVREIPEDQNVFEIWNEPWQWKTLSAEDFATLANWAAEAIIEVRPNAVIGPNIYATVNEYDKRVIAAGKLRNQKMIGIHPYCSRTTEYRGFRQILRNYRDYVEAKTGKKIDFYATEFGWSTAPQGQRVTTEAGQARNTVREALELYAGDVKTLIPHTMASREYDPKDREHYFGYFRLNGEPKPALIAFSNCARMIDGSRFVGEHDFGHGIGAMRFEKDGVQTLALWTEDKELPFTVDTGVDEITVVDIMGRASKQKCDGGRLKLTLSGDPLYLVGIAPAPADTLIGPEDELMPDRWQPRKTLYTIPRSARLPGRSEPAAYGGEPLFKLADKKASRSSLKSYWSWTPGEVAILFDVKDRKIVLTGPNGKGGGDRLELDLCARPGRQYDAASLFDYRFTVIPATEGKAAQLRVSNPAYDKTLELAPGKSAPGIRWSYQPTQEGYRVELRLKSSALGVGDFKPDQRLAFRTVLYNRDRTDVDEWKTYHTRVATQNSKDRYNQLNMIRLTEGK